MIFALGQTSGQTSKFKHSVSLKPKTLPFSLAKYFPFSSSLELHPNIFPFLSFVDQASAKSSSHSQIFSFSFPSLIELQPLAPATAKYFPFPLSIQLQPPAPATTKYFLFPSSFQLQPQPEITICNRQFAPEIAICNPQLTSQDSN